jgi:tetratricopeptide (TPR) repeat protein
MIPVLFLALVVSLAEIAIYWSAAAGYISLVFALLLHLLLSGFVSLNIFTLKTERAAILFLAAGTLFMGPFGAVGGILMALFALFPSGTDFQSYRRSLGPDGEDHPFALSKPITGSDRSLISFHDVMRWGTRAEKQIALRRIVERYSPVFSGVLKRAMEDPAPEIRSEAAAATNSILGKLETDARARAEAVSKAAKAPQKYELLVAYGDAEMAIARCELASPDRTTQARRSALKAYNEARRGLPEAPQLHLKTARVFFDAGALSDAARESQAALAKTSKDFSQNEEALSTHLETLFALGRYGEIRRILTQVPATGRMKRAAVLWRAPKAGGARVRKVRRYA